MHPSESKFRFLQDQFEVKSGGFFKKSAISLRPVTRSSIVKEIEVTHMGRLSGPTIITLSMNCPEDTERTLESISNQTTQPFRTLVVDSSKDGKSNRVKELCRKYSAEYLWVAPDGIYSAMRFAVTVLDEDEYCMFINSGDRLQDAKSLELINRFLIESPGGRPAWLIGGISMVSDTGKSVPYLISANRDDFGERLRVGEIWLPHPSTVYHVGSLKRVHPFEDNLKIASDFATGLRMFDCFGPPTLVPHVLSIFYEGGLSTVSPLRVQFENSFARVAVFGFSVMLREAYRLTRFLSWYFIKWLGRSLFETRSRKN